MNTEQLAAEAAKQCEALIPASLAITLGPTADDYLPIIKAAIEKATELLQKQLAMANKLYDTHLQACTASRAAHASERVTQKIIDLAYRVICEHSGECELEKLPNEMQCMIEQAAHASENVVAPPSRKEPGKTEMSGAAHTSDGVLLNDGSAYASNVKPL